MDLAAEPVMLHHKHASEDCRSCQVLISAHLPLPGAIIPWARTSSTCSASSESENGWDVPQLMDVLGPQADTLEAEENPRDESKPGEELDGNLKESSDAKAWEEELDMTMKPGAQPKSGVGMNFVVRSKMISPNIQRHYLCLASTNSLYY